MKYKITLSDLSFGQEEIDAVSKVIESGWLSQGKQTEKFELEFAKKLNVKYACAVSNCTNALHLALAAAGIGKGDEVIVPSITFVATANAVVYAGAKPVFADIESLDKPIISPADVESKITSKTKAVIPVHFAGFPANMKALKKIAKKNNIKIIEDCAHSINVKYDSRKLGGIGDAGCFSFFANKNITTGEGGMITTNNKEIYQRAKLMRSHSMTSSSYERDKVKFIDYDVKGLGFNYRITELTAALGLAQLKKLQKINAKRRSLTKLYRKLLKNVNELIIPFADYREDSGYHIFPVVIKDIDTKFRLIEYLNKKGIQISHHYKPIHLFELYRKSAKRNTLKVSEEFSSGEITLPLHQHLTNEEIKYICEQIKKGLVVK